VNPDRKKIWRRVTIAVGVLVLLLVGFLIEEHIRGRKELDAYIAQMRARGEKFTIEELTPTPAPPERNGAGALMASGFPSSKLLSFQTPGSFRFIAPGTALPTVSFHSWLVSGESELVLATNFALFEIETNRPVATTNRSGRRSPPPTQKSWQLITAQDVANELAPHSNTLAQIRAALAAGQIDYGLAYSKGFNIKLPQLTKEKSAAQWMRAASFGALQQTNVGAALENLLALAALSHATTNEVLMISQLVRIAVLQITVAATWEALQFDGWNDSQLEQLQWALAPQDFVSAMTRALEMERPMGVMMIDKAAQDYDVLKDLIDTRDSIGLLIGSSRNDDSDEPLAKFNKVVGSIFQRFVYFPIWSVTWKDQDKLHLLQSWQVAIDSGRAQVKQPNWTSHKVGAGEVAPLDLILDPIPKAKDLSAYDRVRFLLSSSGIDATVTGTRSLQRAVIADASQELAVTAIALRRFQLANGGAAESLGQLIPKFLSSVPVDPFDGQPLRYKKNSNDSWTLYSVGSDGKDDGGNAVPPQKESRPNFLNGRDIVWPHAATPEEIEKFAEGMARPKRPR
jgi:hypothetical protein